jgi:acyl carrier protein
MLRMNEFLTKIAEILEVDRVSETDELKAFSQWDSLSVLSVIAMVDAGYGVNLHASELAPVKSVGALWDLVQSRKPA